MPATKTAVALAALIALHASKASDPFTAEGQAAEQALTTGTDALLVRDLNNARAKAGLDEVAAPTRAHGAQSHREFEGYLCSDQRTADYVAAWAARYLCGGVTPWIEPVDGGYLVCVSNRYTGD